MIRALIWRIFSAKAKRWDKNLEYSTPQPVFHTVVSRPATTTHCGVYQIFVSRFFEKIPWKQCGNYGNLLSHFFGKKFVKTTFLPAMNLLNSWFDEIFFQWERISRFFTLWCRNYGNSLSLHSRIFAKNFLKVTAVLLNIYLLISILKN